MFGERINRGTTAERAASIVRARAVARRLRLTGWTFASHSYGHIDARTHTTDAIRIDAKRWLAEMTTVLGPTDVYIFPLGSTPPLQSDKVAALRELGFTVQCGIDAAPRLLHVNGITYMARRHIDGLAFSGQVEHLAQFFDVNAVIDRAARSL